LFTLIRGGKIITLIPQIPLINPTLLYNHSRVLGILNTPSPPSLASLHATYRARALPGRRALLLLRAVVVASNPRGEGERKDWRGRDWKRVRD